ncbi:MAG: formylglycine-generating enzyme family protein [Bacteroidota bacterium]
MTKKEVTMTVSHDIQINLDETSNIKMIHCPSGQYIMGSSSKNMNVAEKPAHLVNIPYEFWVSETLITRNQYNCIMNIEEIRVNEDSLESPACQYNWNEAIILCETIQHKILNNEFSLIGIDFSINKYSLSLPTEVQWEYLCRAGTTTNWYFGDDKDLLPQYAWFDQTAFAPLPKVKQKKANPWKIYDLYGMAFEWCLNDTYSYGHGTGKITYPDANINQPVLKAVRGGSFYSSAANCRSASRSELDHWNSENDLTGIRIVLNHNFD